MIEDDAIRNNPVAFPDDTVLNRCETFRYLGDKVDQTYNELWNKVKSN